jgi:hypothetical protein
MGDIVLADLKVAGPAQLSDPLQGPAPQLARALLEARPGWYPAYWTPLEKDIQSVPQKRNRIDLKDKDAFDADLTVLLGHVEARIKMGLDEAWLSGQGYGWRPPPEVKAMASKDELDQAMAAGTFQSNLLHLYNDPEEKWARAFTETFAFCMYGGPGVIYSQARRDDPRPMSNRKFYEALKAAPAVYPVAVACQHLTTFAVLSRGRSVDDVGEGLDCAGSSATKKAFKKGMKFTKKGECNTTSCILDHVGPGDAVFFNFHGPDSGSQAAGSGTVHAATVLRTWGKKLQYFDTGVLTSSGVPGASEGGTTDHDWAGERLGTYNDAVGLGVLGDKPADLGSLADALSKARPLAVARLVVFDEQARTFKSAKGVSIVRKNRVRYASRLLHLWLDDGGVPLSKLIWAIRNAPTSGLRLAWWVYLPKGHWLDGFLDASAPSKPVATLLQQPEDGLDYLFECNILFSDRSGDVTVYRKYAKDTKDGAKEGWSHGFGQEGGLPAGTAPWVAFGPNDASAFDVWSRTPKAYGQAYRVKDPSSMTGEVFDDQVGVPFFDQGT